MAVTAPRFPAPWQRFRCLIDWIVCTEDDVDDAVECSRVRCAKGNEAAQHPYRIGRSLLCIGVAHRRRIPAWSLMALHQPASRAQGEQFPVRAPGWRLPEGVRNFLQRSQLAAAPGQVQGLPTATLHRRFYDREPMESPDQLVPCGLFEAGRFRNGGRFNDQRIDQSHVEVSARRRHSVLLSLCPEPRALARYCALAVASRRMACSSGRMWPRDASWASGVPRAK